MTRLIGVELHQLVRSRRTWVTILLIDLLPTIVAVLLAVTDIGPRPGSGPAFLSAVLTDGTLFPLAAMATRSPERPSRAPCATSWSVRSVGPACCWPSSSA